MFQFKQFAVDQFGCAMKINTDGVLLGALAQGDRIDSILDIGTGTGVIALMLAQRFTAAQIDAVEIDESAAQTARQNFENSVFNDRITAYHLGFEAFLQSRGAIKYDLIVSNPPFYIHSLKSPGKQLAVAKHTDEQFFDGLLKRVSNHLTDKGLCWLILPVSTALVVQNIAERYGLHTHTRVNILSYPDSEAHRYIIAFSKFSNSIKISNFIIYDSPKVYTDQYQKCLKDFFTIF